MSNYNSLKATIDANVKQNGIQSITGQLLNSVLNAMVTTLGTGYQFAGVATTATDPSSPDAKVFYIANGKGTYTNFGGIEVTEDDVVVLYWDSSWHKVSTGIASNAKLTELEDNVNGSESILVDKFCVANTQVFTKDDVIIGQEYYVSSITTGHVVALVNNDGVEYETHSLANKPTFVITDEFSFARYKYGNGNLVIKYYNKGLSDRIATNEQNIEHNIEEIASIKNDLAISEEIISSAEELIGYILYADGIFIAGETPGKFRTYKIVNDGSIKKLKVYASTTTAIALAVGFYTGNEISQSTYLKDVSVPLVVNTSKFYEVDVPSNATIIVVCNRGATDDAQIYNYPTVKDAFDSLLNSDNNLNEVLETRQWKGKTISILGDSISTFGTPDQNNALGLYTYPYNKCRYPQVNLFTDVKYTYWMRLIKALNMLLGINDSIRSSRVSWNGITEDDYQGADKHIASTTRIGHLGENGTPDMIIVYAGTNDAGNAVPIGTIDYSNPMSYTQEEIDALPVNTFANAYRTMLIRLMHSYPMAKIYCIVPNFTSSYYGDNLIENLDKYCECIKEICDMYGVKWIDSRTSGITPFNVSSYLPDGVHPNADGMELIYRNILKNL